MVSLTIHVFIPTVTAAQRRQSPLLMTLFILEEKKHPVLMQIVKSNKQKTLWIQWFVFI